MQKQISTTVVAAAKAADEQLHDGLVVSTDGAHGVCGPHNSPAPRFARVRCTNNQFESKAGVNAMKLKYMITGERVSAPRTLIQTYPQLSKFADPSR